MDKNYNVITFTSKSFILRRPAVVNFVDINKIATMAIKTTFKDSKKGKKNIKNVLKCNLLWYFLLKQKSLVSGKEMLMSGEINECVT